MLKMEPAPIHLRWATQGTACNPETTLQVEAPASVTSPYSERRSFDSDDAESHYGRKSDESDSDLEVIYQCPCGRRFTRSAAYHRHLDVAHSNSECHKCSECGKTFGNERTLTMHMSVHQDSKQFTSTIERCSRSRSSQKSYKTNGSNNNHAVTTINTTRARVEKINNGLAQTAHSITSNNTSLTCTLSTEGLPDSSQNCSKESHATSSEEEFVGTDKENYSPKRDSDVSTDLASNSELSPTDSVPPLINSHAKPGFELDLGFPKSKVIVKSVSNESVIISSDVKTITPSELVSRFGGDREHATTVGNNKVSIITIKTDRSLLSDSLVFHTKSGKTGDFVVSSGSHSVIVIKTQDSKNKLNGTCVRLEPVNTKDVPKYSNETTCLDDDANLVRKSQRLQGKIPGWKHILDPTDTPEQKAKRRKMAKVKVEDMTNGYKIKEEAAAAAEYIFNRNRENVRVEDIRFCDLKKSRLANPSKDSCGMVKSDIFKCAACERSFASEKYLSMHMSLHKVDNSMESLMQQNSKDEDLEALNAKAIKAATANANGAYWTCKICNKVFAQNSNYKNHIRTHSDERPFVCQICSIGFKERYHLKKHMLFKHSDELKEECRYCGKKFKDSTAVRAHERIHSDVRPYSCRRCGKSFKTSECLWHHENRSKTCGQALLGIPAPSPRFKRGRQPKKEDKVTPGGITVIPMTTNGQQFIPGTSLLISDASQVINSNVTSLPHYAYSEIAAATASIQSPNLQHLVPVSTMPEPQLVRVHCNPIISAPTTAHAQGFITSSYGKDASTFVTAPTNAVQTQTLHPFSTTPMVSSQVMVKVEPESALSDYELTAMTSSDGSYGDNNADILMDEDPSLPSVAMIESIESESGIAEISHETILQLEEEIKKDAVLEDIEMSLLEKSGGAEDFDMDEDDEMVEEDDEFDDIEDYSLYADKKSNDSHYTCDKCGKHFVSVSTFDKHLLTHSGLRPYVCSICNVGFKLKVHLKKHHLYRHSDEKPCECTICGKKFKDSSAVRLHERIHSTDRPFQCECGKTFKTRENLWGHRHRGPCENKAKYSEIIAPSPVNVFSHVPSSTVAVSNSHVNGPIYAHAQLGDTLISAHAAMKNNQMSQVVSNNNIPPKVGIYNSIDVKDTDSGLTEKMVAAIVNKVADISNANSDANGSKPATPHVSVVTSRSDVAPVIFSRSQESRVSLPVLSAPATGVPTAVVAPLKREVAGVSINGGTIPSTSILKPLKHNMHVEIQKPPAPKLIAEAPAPKIITEPHDQPDTSLPPFETFSPTLRSKGPTLADRCPTIQRYLQMARQPVKLPGIQQLFQSHAMTHGVRTAGLAPPVAMAHSLLPMRCSDPSAPLGPHPSLNSPPSPSLSTRSIQSPVPANPQIYASSPKSPCPGQILITTPAMLPRYPGSALALTTNQSLPSTGVYLPQMDPTPGKHSIRSTSPYPGALPLLLPIDPNMASTSGDALTTQSPAETPNTTFAQTLPVASWDDDRKVVHTSVWHTDQEQLFQDLAQTTALDSYNVCE